MAGLRRARLFCLLVLPLIAGCGGAPSAQARIDGEMQRMGKTRDKVFPLAGRVLLDGQPANFKKASQKLIVMLNDPAHPEAPLGARPFVECGPDGRFTFNSYLEADGVPSGHYVVTFAQLIYRKKRGHCGPDGLKNLYNDPDENVKVAEFNIDHHAPGKTDYVFDLQVAGREPISSPGPKALVAIGN
jgi:hypothetical protein